MTTKELASLLKNVTILYVEDDDTIRETMQSALQNFTNRVIVASSGDEALACYEQNHPQIIISDIVMPKLDGLHLVEAIRKDNLQIPIILLTAFTQKEYLLPAANLNIQSYLVKPVKTKELKEALYKAVEILSKNGSLFVKLPHGLKYNKLSSELISEDGKPIKLNKKEKMLFDLLLDNVNRVVTYEEIENSVWSDYYEVMTSMALRTVIKNLRKKVSVEFIENISGQGYKITI